MPTVKSSSAKKLKTNESARLKQVTDWTKNELAGLRQNSKIPICIQLQNGDYIVGTFKVEKVSSGWNAGGFEFTDKRGAIFFCVLMHLNRFNDANEIHDADCQVSRLDLDKSAFRARLDNAHLENDQFKIDLYSSRYEDAKRKLVYAKQELEKVINKVKYILR